MNVLKPHLRITIETLLARGTTQREIARRTGVDQDDPALRRNGKFPRGGHRPGRRSGQIPPPRPPAPAPAKTESACEPHRAWIETQVGLGRSAVSIYQSPVEGRAASIAKTR